ncbi:MAG: ornithine cyclodeaminase family protein [Pseudomonadota bacterium]
MTAPLVLNADDITARLKRVDAVAAVRNGFIAYSQGKAVIPAPGELNFSDPPGDAHIKYGRLEGGDHYVVKIASGFPENMRRFQVPTSQGLMLLFDANTGAPRAVLFDEGLLTRARTAIAGALATEVLAPSQIDCIGVLGSGVQARLQLEYVKDVTLCRTVKLWSPDPRRRQDCAADLAKTGFDATAVSTPAEVAKGSQLIITTTRSESPLLSAADVEPGTHVTAVGSDTTAKTELASDLLGKADFVVADSKSQCQTRGEISHALRAGAINNDDVIELGAVLGGMAEARSADHQITIADLTGVAVQDLAIAEAVFQADHPR